MVHCLSNVIRKAEKVEFYMRVLSLRAFNDKELPSLDDFLSLTSGEAKQEVKAFDSETDKILEAQALKSLNERRSTHV